MSKAQSRDDDLMLVNAYLDGELDAAAALAFERRMEKDKGLRAAHDRLTALRVAFKGLTLPSVSEGFRSRVDRIAPPASSAAGPARASYSWRQMAASIVVAAGLASGATFLGLQQASMPNSTEQVIAGHERSLMAASPVDVVSSDQHTVKPWFDQHLALSPPVPDLSASGFPLEGGRVEIVDGKPAPVLVYKLRKHLISLVAEPKPGISPHAPALEAKGRDGYQVLGWAERDFQYYAVSDIAGAELEGFVAKWRENEAEP